MSIGGTTASVTLDLPAAISPLLTTVTSGPVTVNLANGEVAVDLAVLKGGSLSGLPANTAVLTSAEVAAISAAVTTIVGDLADALETAVTAALSAATVSIVEIAAGTSAISITALGALPVGLLTDVLLATALAPIATDLLNPSTGALQAFIDGLQTGVVTPVATTLSPILEALDTLLALTVNNQELIGTAPNQEFVETALRVGLLAQGPVVSVLELNIARSAVGPNRAGVRPAIANVDPTGGPTTGGTTVTITGTDFGGSTGVTFDGVAGTSLYVGSDTEITIVTPAHAVGPTAVVVEHHGGDTAAGTFAFLTNPAVTSLTPGAGPLAGGTVVTIVGSGFTGATGARFGSVWGTNFTVLSDTMATVVTPAHDAMWVPAILAAGATEVSTPGFTFQLTTLADADNGLAFTGSTGKQAGWFALPLNH